MDDERGSAVELQLTVRDTDRVPDDQYILNDMSIRTVEQARFKRNEADKKLQLKLK